MRSPTVYSGAMKEISTPAIEAARAKIAAIKAEAEQVGKDFKIKIEALEAERGTQMRAIRKPLYDLEQELQNMLKAEVKAPYVVGDILEYEYERTMPNYGSRYSPRKTATATQQFEVRNVLVADDGTVKYYGDYILKNGGRSVEEYVIIKSDRASHEKEPGEHMMKKVRGYGGQRINNLRKQGEPKPEPVEAAAQ